MSGDLVIITLLVVHGCTRKLKQMSPCIYRLLCHARMGRNDTIPQTIMFIGSTHVLLVRNAKHQ